MKLLYKLVEYISELTGTEIYPEELSRESQEGLPVFISQNYLLYTATVLGKDYVLLIHQRGKIPTPNQAASYAEKVGINLRTQAVFVFPRLDAYIRMRLIGKSIPFIVPYQHLFLPLAIMDFREQSSRGQSPNVESDKISISSQVMLLYYFHHYKQVKGWPLKKWAKVLGYSSMTISRAWKELAAKNLCQGQKRGRSTILIFPKSNRGLWDSALPYLRNPVRHRKSAKIVNADRFKLHSAGLTALAERTLISRGVRAEFAMTLSAWNSAIKQSGLMEVSAADESGVVIETWRYDPSILARREQSVDELSLYLSLQDEPDERIQGALEEMMDAFPWPG